MMNQRLAKCKYDLEDGFPGRLRDFFTYASSIVVFWVEVQHIFQFSNSFDGEILISSSKKSGSIKNPNQKNTYKIAPTSDKWSHQPLQMAL